MSDITKRLERQTVRVEAYVTTHVRVCLDLEPKFAASLESAIERAEEQVKIALTGRNENTCVSVIRAEVDHIQLDVKLASNFKP